MGHATYALTDDRTPTTPVPVYVKRHSGTPPSGIEKYEPSRPTRELAPDPVPATTGTLPPSKSRLGLVLLAAVFVVAALVFAYSMFRGMTGAASGADTARTAAPAADTARAAAPATDTTTMTPNVTPDTAQPPAR